MLNKKLLNVLSVMQILFLFALSITLLYIAIYNPCLLTPVIILAIFILIAILSSSSMLNRMLHTKIGNALSIFIIIFFIFGYYKGYIMEQKPPANYAIIGIILMFIIIICSLFYIIKENNRVHSRTKINN